MRRNKLSYFEELDSEGGDFEAVWPELRGALRQPANTQDLGLWGLAEEPPGLARRRPTLVRPTPPAESRFPDFPDAA